MPGFEFIFAFFIAWVVALVATGAGAGWIFHRALPTGPRLWVDLLIGVLGAILGAFARGYFPGIVSFFDLSSAGCLGALALLFASRVVRPPLRASRLVVRMIQVGLAVVVVGGLVVLVAFPLALRWSVPPAIKGSPLVAELSYLMVTVGSVLLFRRVGRWPRPTESPELPPV